MSTPRAKESIDLPGPPYAGALLRLAWEGIRKRILRAIGEAGFDDIVPAHFSILVYPGPDQVHPSDLAARANISKQAANYLISQLEERGYIERRTVKGKGRLVCLTPRGRRLIPALHDAVRTIEVDFSRSVGAGQYRQFRETLVRLVDLTAAEHV
jgi:DNA-binding MarR family transcriptional regulator